MLSDAQVERYSRQILLPEVGGRGQERLLAARVALAGAGRAAAVAATLLGRAGVGALELIGPAPALGEPSPDCCVGRHAALAGAPDADVWVASGADAALAAALGGRALAAGRPFVLGTLAGTRVEVATLTGRPCAACYRGDDVAQPAPAILAAAAELALGALAAAEALLALLSGIGQGRQTSLALGAGGAVAAPLAPSTGCARCGGTA